MKQRNSKAQKTGIGAIMLLVTLSFIVAAAAQNIELSSNNISIDESLIITITNISNYDLTISNEQTKYKLYGQSENSILFKPKETGQHQITLLYLTNDSNITFPKTQTQNFNVYEKQEPEDLEIISTELKNTKLIIKSTNKEDKEKISINKITNYKGFPENKIKEMFEVKTNNTNATLIKEAQGTQLLECKIWNNNKCETQWTKIKDIIPGETYEVQITKTSAYIETGIVTINTKKPIYKPGEIAEIIIAAIDNKGYLVHDANITVQITDPNNNTETINKIIMTSPGVYETIYENTQNQGRYKITVSAKAPNVDSTLKSYFDVKEYYEFDIIRNAPVTTDPFTGPFTSKIKAISNTNEDTFSIIERLPLNFEIIEAQDAIITESGNKKEVRWNNIKNNTYVTYKAQPPKITPDLYELGKAIILYGNKIFEEARTWFLAIDPLVFYDPNSNIEQGWTQGTGFTYTEIDDGVRQPSVPNTDDYLAQLANTNLPSQFGTPTISENNIEYIRLWVYTGTGNNAQYTFELRQGITTRCSMLMLPSSATGWMNCTWTNPTGALDDLRIYLSGVTKNGGGQNQNAFVYAAYLEVFSGVPPQVTLNSPDDNTATNTSINDFNFTVTDDMDATMANCSLLTNETGTYGVSSSIPNVLNATQTNITYSLSDGTYLWNIQCTDQGPYTNTSSQNRTIIVNNNTPSITNYEINTTAINQSEHVYFNVSITDLFSISTARITVEYPNGSSINHDLQNTGSEYYFTITNTNETGTYTVNNIYAADGYERTTTINPSLSFTVTASPPGLFNLISPANNTISNDQTPTLSWQQTTEIHFENYTILIDDNEDFSSRNYEFSTSSITSNSTTTTTMSPNTEYYWKVIAYDVFGSSTNSSQYWKYIIDTLPPTISLNEPENNNFYLSNNIKFNYTPSDLHLVTCELYTNETSWSSKATNNTPISGIKNSFSQTLPDGAYLWNIQCTDNATNTAFATSNYTTLIDTTPPTTNLELPENNTLENTTNNIVFQYNTTDIMTDIASCRLIIDDAVIDTDYTITETTTQNFTAFVQNGDHNWSINCTDTNGYQNKSLTYNLSVDVTFETDPPVTTLSMPQQNNYSQQNTLLFNYTPSDATGIQNCSIYLDGTLNQTNITITNNAPNYFTINSISEAQHTWLISCYDNNTYAQGNSTTRTFTIDLTNPQITLDAPVDNEISASSQVTFNYTSTDTNIDYCQLYANFSGSWVIENTNLSLTSGSSSIFTETINDGTYLWSIRCTDLSGRTNTSENRTIKIDSDTPSITQITTNPITPTNYNEAETYEFNATITDSFLDTVQIEHNFTGTSTNYTVNSATNTYSYNYSSMAAGTYYYRWHANDSTNKINSTTQYTYIVNKADPGLNLYLNNIQDNITINESQTVTKTANLTHYLVGYVELYQNSILINNGTTPISNTTNYTQPGSYNITAHHPECVNYTSSQKTYFIDVNDITNPIVNLISPANDSTTGNPEVTYMYNVTDKTNVNNCSLYLDGSLDQTDESITKDIDQYFTKTLPDGNYTWKVSCQDEYGNEGNSTEFRVEVIESTGLNVTLTTDKTKYQQGETAQINTTVKDEFNQAVYQAATTTYLIDTNTSKTWWNENWKKRKPILINETSGSQRTNDVIDINLTGLNINGCYNELRIINHNQTTPQEIPYKLYDGDNSTWCHIAFRVNINASQINNENYYVYYNATSPSDPNYNLDTDTHYSYFATTSAQDEGIVTNPGDIAGSNDATFAQIAVSGGGEAYESASGREFITNTPSTIIKQVLARYRYEITTSSANWYLRYSIDDGITYSNVYVGTTATAKQTTSWLNITSAYPSLTWANLNQTRLQGRVYKPGGGSAVTMNLYWVELNVTTRGETYQMQTNMGEEQNLVDYYRNETNINAIMTWSMETLNKPVNNYSIITYAEKTGFINSTGRKDIEIIADSTPPLIDLNSPAEGYNTSNENITFIYTITEFSGNATCNITINGQANITGITSYDQVPINRTINNLPEGKNTWSIICIDKNSNTNTSQTRNFTIDKTPPQIINMQPVNGYNATNTTINFNYTAQDALSAIINCTVNFDDISATAYKQQNNNTLFNHTISNISYGRRNWSVTCKDNVNNTNITQKYELIVLSPPTNQTPTYNENKSITLTWDNIAEAESYNIYITNNITAGFSETPDVTGITTPTYTDQMAGNDEERYYKITSVRNTMETDNANIIGKHTQELGNGMNLISVPFQLPSTQIKSQSNDGFEPNADNNCVQTLWQYTPSSGYKRTDWLGTYFEPAAGSEDFTKINQTLGYWIETNQTCNITFLGTVPTQNITVPLQDTYNLVPWYSAQEKILPTNYDVPIINTNPPNTVQSINRYNTEQSKFEVTVYYIISGTPWGWWPSANNPDFTALEPMRGYFMDANETSTWEHQP